MRSWPAKGILAHEGRIVSRVVITRAGSYGEARQAVGRALSLLGGLEAFVPPEAKVFVKINHLPPPSPPERGIITHPAFTEAVLEALLRRTPHITVGDDIRSEQPDGFTVSGYRAMCQRLGVRLVNLRELGFMRVPGAGVILKEAYLARALLEAEVIVNLPKFKTHYLTTLTGAIKNLYGAIPAGLRTQYHGQYNKLAEFNQVLVDIFSVAEPHLTLMDGIVAMEGAGPAGGTLRNLGLVLASRDAVALDAVVARIMGLDPFQVGAIRFAHERGLGSANLSAIQVVGEALEAVAVRDFKLPPLPAGEIVGRAPRFLTSFVTRQLVVRPRVVRARCTGCRACAEMCPTGAAQVHKGKARIARALCIRCMCCHEACRFGAIVLTRSLPGRLLSPVVRAVRRTKRRR